MGVVLGNKENGRPFPVSGDLVVPSLLGMTTDTYERLPAPLTLIVLLRDNTLVQLTPLQPKIQSL